MKNIRVIDFKSFKELPKSVVAAYIVSVVFALGGLSLIIFDMLGVAPVPQKYGMGLIVISQIISLFNVRKYRDKMFR